MRMAGPDIILFVVGAVLFGGATYAIVSLDGGVGNASSSGIFNVAFSSIDEELAREAVGDLRAPAPIEFDVTAEEATHLISLVISVECNDPAGAAVPFAIQVTIEGPGGQTADASGNCGSAIEAAIPISPMPESTVVQASTEDEATASLERSLGSSTNATAAVGTWTVTVSGGRQGAPPLGLPVGNPGGAIVVTAEEWDAQFTAVR